MAIARAGYQLFAERGYEATTIADIAEVAEVAPRTVAMYFPSKLDIALSRFGETVASLTEAIRGIEPGEKLTGALGAWLRARDVTPAELEMAVLARRMFAANPQLRALQHARMDEAIKAGAAAIAAETGGSPGDAGPMIASAAAGAVLAELADTPAGTDRDESITIAMSFLQAGIDSLKRRCP